MALVSVNSCTGMAFLFFVFISFVSVLSERGLINKNLFDKHAQSPKALFSDEVVSLDSFIADASDVTLLGPADGYIHAIDPSTSEKLWSSDIGGPLVSSYQSHAKPNEGEYATVLPNVDGSVLIHSSNGGMRKTSVKARLLAEKVSSLPLQHLCRRIAQ